MDQRLQFIKDHARQGRGLAGLCRAYGISRKTAYKWLDRYEEDGPNGLRDRGRAPLHPSHRLSDELSAEVLAARRKHPTWGPRKLAELLRRSGLSAPALSTIGDLLKREGLVKPRRTRRQQTASKQLPLEEPGKPNDLWCVDYKGQFRMGNGDYCYPLTVTDDMTRYLLACDGMAAIDGKRTQATFERLFSQHGIPRAIRSDNGSPFASTGPARLSKLSVWWMTQGIRLERISPGHPEQNGRHERMHRTLKAETTRPPEKNLRSQQHRFDSFRQEFNEVRPHEAIDLRVPASLYKPRRTTRRPFSLAYPSHYEERKVAPNGCIRFRAQREIFLSSALTGHHVGLVEEDDEVWCVFFGPIRLGLYRADKRRFMPFAVSRSHRAD